MSKNTFHVITSTNVGGAEIMLEKFLTHHNSARHSTVLTLTTIGEIGKRINKLGVSVVALQLRSSLKAFLGLIRFIKLVYKYQPDTIIAWMYHANLFVTLFSFLYPRSYIVWNVRCGISQYKSHTFLKMFILKMSRALSRLPDKIIFNSKRSMDEHIKYGYYPCNCRVVYNGFEPKKCSDLNRNSIRNDVGINENAFLIGSFGRNIRLKRMADLLKVCAKLRAKGCPAELLYVGRNFNTSEFKEKMIRYGVHGKVHIVQEVSSLHPYYSAIDAFCLCSENEGFPNVIGEAVYSKVPVFCTDVGDMKNEFLRTWQVSDVGDISSLTKAAFKIYSMGHSGRRILAAEQYRHFSNKTDINRIVIELAKLFSPVNN